LTAIPALDKKVVPKNCNPNPINLDNYLLLPKNCNPCSKGIKIVIWSGAPPPN